MIIWTLCNPNATFPGVCHATTTINKVGKKALSQREESHLDKERWLRHGIDCTKIPFKLVFNTNRINEVETF